VNLNEKVRGLPYRKYVNKLALQSQGNWAVGVVACSIGYVR